MSTKIKTLGRIIGLSASTVLVACTSAGPLPPGDSENDSFIGKADGRYSDCQLLEALKLVNASTTDTGSLKDILQISSGSDAAKAIIEYRNGPDGDLGTADDNLFENLEELDAQKFVGPLALDLLVEASSNACVVDLSNRPFMDANTFASAPAFEWPRNGVEFESVYGVSGISGRELNALLTTRDSNGRSLYDKIRRVHLMEAFSFDYGVDEMPWDKDSHEAREGLPHIALSIEPGRYESAAPGEVREVSLGTDLMDDTYYDTLGFDLFRNGMVLRGRARWDTPTEVRRILIGAKFDSTVDENGIKRAKKIDVRDDSSAHVATLDQDVRRGMTSWSGTDGPAAPVRAIYEAMTQKVDLPDIDMHQNVLLLDPQVRLRSRRSRYHQNEASIEAVNGLYNNGSVAIGAIKEIIERERAAGTLTGADLAAADSFEALVQTLQDGSEVATRTGLTTADFDMPAAFVSDRARLENNRIAAEAYSAAMHDLVTFISDDFITLVTHEPDDERINAALEQFQAWRISLDQNLATKRVLGPFLAILRSLDPATALTEFNTYAQAQKDMGNEVFEDFEPLSEDDWKELGNEMESEHMEILRRQIEAAGTMAQTIWFDTARQFYVPSSYRQTSNFMIDTFDMTQMLSNEEWLSIPEAERDFTHDLPPEKIMNTVLVNELQIELGQEAAYVMQIDALTAQIQGGDMTPETAAMLEGATFVLNEYIDAMKHLGDLKGSYILKRLKNAGASKKIKWEHTDRSKGDTAIAMYAEGV